MAKTPTESRPGILLGDERILTTKDIAELTEGLMGALKELHLRSIGHGDKAHKRIDILMAALERMGNFIEDKVKDKATKQEVERALQPLHAWKKTHENSTVQEDLKDALISIEDLMSGMELLQTRLDTMKQIKVKNGLDGKTPEHEWDDTQIRFQNPDGSWGEWVDLRGRPGPAAVSREEVFGSLQGVQRVRGGTNVTVTSDGNGGVVVNSSGGGFTIMTPTAGAVDESNRVFTFTAAPQVVVLDNGNQMNQVSADGTVNWTGTTTITLAQAPNFNIYAF